MSVSYSAADKEKVTRLKLQCAKVMLRERRYEGARLILESVDHPTAEELLERMPAENGTRSRSSMRDAVLAGVLILGAVFVLVGFGLGRMTAPASVTDNQQVIDSENILSVSPSPDIQAIAPITMETPSASETVPTDVIGTPMLEHYLTGTAINATQDWLEAQISASETARYTVATAQASNSDN